MSFDAFLPWHTDVAKAWLKDQDRFAHAWLIHGLAGIGKREFSFAAARSLLCENPVDGMACGQCVACGWVNQGNHPDLRRIRPEAIAIEEGANQDSDEEGGGDSATSEVSGTKKAPSKDIRIDQIRSLEPWFNNATHRGGWRIALIYPAEALTVISANALLKVLEEPPPSTVFLLVADAPDRLLPTLLSRCRRLPLATPPKDIAHNWLLQNGVKQPDLWLAASGGAPLLAKTLSATHDNPCPSWISEFVQSLSKGNMPDIGKIADLLSKSATTSWIDSLQRLIIDALMVANGLQARYFPTMQSHLDRIFIKKAAVSLSDLSIWLNEQQRVAGHPLNTKLFAHSVIQKVAGVFMRASQLKK